MSQSVVRCKWPHVVPPYCHAITHPWMSKACRRAFSSNISGARDVTHDFEKRVSQLKNAKGLSQCYPQLSPKYHFKQSNGLQRLSVASSLTPGETLRLSDEEPAEIAGRVTSVRAAGSKLIFLDLQLDNAASVRKDRRPMQIVCQFGELEKAGVTLAEFKLFSKLARPGDWFSFVGWPHRTSRGEPSMLVTQRPTLLSPSLHQRPERLDSPETRARKRHVDMIVNPGVTQTLRVRHEIEMTFHDFFNSRGFTKVTTPLLSGQAGGAVARPFTTVASELADQQLQLRIAPELWLKRLVVGGLERIYEIGPAFRNEGVDATHNPEFSICEFYQAFATLEDLMEQTEALFDSLVRSVKSGSLPEGMEYKRPFPRIKFIGGLESALGRQLPDLAQPDALDIVKGICEESGVELPAQPTLPRLLDALAARFLEPQCASPTFITHHPACMSPLSKHIMCESGEQVVAARAELFIQGREFANMYEEENSPFEQRRKFEEQLELRKIDGEGDGHEHVDESYLEALEWGLPPTGGWGCGMDRLVMLFSGQERIADVLSFGSLRTVAGLARGRR